MTLAALNWPTIMTLIGGAFILAIAYRGWTKWKERK